MAIRIISVILVIGVFVLWTRVNERLHNKPTRETFNSGSDLDDWIKWILSNKLRQYCQDESSVLIFPPIEAIASIVLGIISVILSFHPDEIIAGASSVLFIIQLLVCIDAYCSSPLLRLIFAGIAYVIKSIILIFKCVFILPFYFLDDLIQGKFSENNTEESKTKTFINKNFTITNYVRS